MLYGLDAGHCTSGSDTGAIGNGLKEQDLTREVVTYLAKYLEEEGHKAKYCHCHSAYSTQTSLQYRVNKANELNVDYFISIHFNAFNGEAYGTETYISGRGGKAEELAKRVNSKLVEYGYYNRGVKTANYKVLRDTNMPALLVEVCFIDNSKDIAKFNAKKVAIAIAEGILNKSIEEKESIPNKPDEKNTYYRVVVGSYTDRENAVKKQEELKVKGENSFLLAFKE